MNRASEEVLTLLSLCIQRMPLFSVVAWKDAPWWAKVTHVTVGGYLAISLLFILFFFWAIVTDEQLPSAVCTALSLVNDSHKSMQDALLKMYVARQTDKDHYHCARLLLLYPMNETLRQDCATKLFGVKEDKGAL